MLPATMESLTGVVTLTLGGVDRRSRLSILSSLRFFVGFTSFSADVNPSCSSPVHFITSLALVKYVKVMLQRGLAAHCEMSFRINRLRNPTSGTIKRSDTRLPDRVHRDQYRWARQHGCGKVQSHPRLTFLLQTPHRRWSNLPPISLPSDDSWRTRLCQVNDIGVTYLLLVLVVCGISSQVLFWKSAKCENIPFCWFVDSVKPGDRNIYRFKKVLYFICDAQMFTVSPLLILIFDFISTFYFTWHLDTDFHVHAGGWKMTVGHFVLTSRL